MQVRFQSGDVPLLLDALGRDVGAEDVGHDAVAQALHHLRQALVLQDLVAQLVDVPALVVGDVVVLEELLADVEVVRLDLPLRALDRAGDERVLDRLALGHLEPLHDRLDALAGEDAQQLVVEREVEARRPGVALAARPAAQLVVDAPRLVALGADDVQAARVDHLLVQRAPFRADRRDARALFVLVDARVGLDHVDLLLGVAAEHDVGAPAGHVGGDRDHLRPPGLHDDLRLVGVLLGVQHLVREARLLQHRREPLRVLDRGRPHQHRLPALVARLDVGEHRLVLLDLGLVDLVEPVGADHRHVGRDHHDLEVVDLLELVGLGVGGAGHAGELLVEAEVVLERDRGERLVLALDLDPLLRLDRLVHAVRPAAALHQPAGELVDDDHLVVLDDVVPVAEEQVVRPQRLVEVVEEIDVRRVVQARPLGEYPGAREERLGGLVPGLGQEHAVVLLVDVEVAGRVGRRLALQHRRDRVHLEIDVGAVVGLAGDDQRRARLVDQDRVDLVHDRVVQPCAGSARPPASPCCRAGSRSRTRCWCRR